MVKAIETNLAMVRHVAGRLGALRERMVFLGGAATALLITDPATPDVRVTTDVDVIVEVASRLEYYRLAELLRSRGFSEDHEEGVPMCRWRVDGIAVDVMPTDTDILGFSNQWYSQALQSATASEIAEGVTIRVVTAPYFLATKIDAFYGRGKGDFMASHDMEDMVTLLDGRPELVAEVRSAPAELRDFLSKSFCDFLLKRDFLDSLPGYLMPDSASQRRISLLMEKIRAVAETS